MMNPISTGLGAIGSFASGLFQQNANKKMMREQMAWNTKEREASQNFTRAERLAQQGYQTSEREAQNAWSEQLYNQYQSPEALRRQYSAAGLDPAMAISGGSTAGSAAGSSGSAPTGASSPVMGVQPPYQNMNAFAQGFGEIANAMKSLADAKKAGVETSQMEEMFADRIKGLKYENELKSLGIEGKKLENRNVAKTYDLLTQQLAKGDAEIGQIKALTYKLEQEGAISKQQAETFMRSFEAEQNKKIAEAGFINEQANTEKTKQDVNRQSVEESKHRIWNIDANTALTRAMRITERTKPQLNKVLTRFHGSAANLNNLAYKIRNASSPEEIKKLKQEYERYYLQFKRDGHYLQVELDDLENNPGTLGELLNQSPGEFDLSGFIARGIHEAREFLKIW